MKLFVGNLPWTTTDEDLEGLFSRCGSVASARVITDRESGRSRGFGFVEMDKKEEAQQAIAEFDGHEIDNRALRVNEATEQRPRKTNTRERW